MMNLLTKIIFSGLMLLSFNLGAHTQLATSLPLDGEVLSRSPETIKLDFSGEVRLVKLVVKGDQNHPVTTNFKPSMTASTSYVITLPQLTQGHYQVHWIALGGDGHKMKGEFSFAVSGK